MSSMWLSWFNWLDAATASINADAEAGELLAENLRQRQSYKIWRTMDLAEDATNAGFTVDFGQVREVQVLALVFPRLNDPNAYDHQADFAETDTVRHRLSAVSAGEDDIFDSGVVASGVLKHYGTHCIVFDQPVEARYWRVDLDAISRAALGYVDVARAWAGPVFSPRIGFSWGDAYGWNSDSSITRASRDPSEFADNIEPVRGWSLTLEGLSDTEADDLIEFERHVTTSGQFLAGRRDVAAGKGVMLARQQQSTGLASLALARNTKAFRLVESG